jgi:molybdopterin-guanine dinucleotide biosynthesis protein B
MRVLAAALVVVAIEFGLAEQEEPMLAEVLVRLAPADLVLIEGYKREPHPKIEVRSGEDDASAPPMAPKDPSIVAIAADRPTANQRLPWFRRDDITGIADFIAGQRQR